MFSKKAKDSYSEPLIWVHRATFTYRLSRPSKQWEALWGYRAGWGFLKGKDLWMPTTLSQSELEANGFVRLESEYALQGRTCPMCGTIIGDVPGALIRMHFQQCSPSTAEWKKLDEFVLEEQRLKIAEERLKREQLEKRLEKEAELKREKVERMREEMAARQTERDRKRRLKEEAKDQFIRS